MFRPGDQVTIEKTYEYHPSKTRVGTHYSGILTGTPVMGKALTLHLPDGEFSTTPIEAIWNEGNTLEIKTLNSIYLLKRWFVPESVSAFLFAYEQTILLHEIKPVIEKNGIVLYVRAEDLDEFFQLAYDYAINWIWDMDRTYKLLYKVTITAA